MEVDVEVSVGEVVGVEVGGVEEEGGDPGWLSRRYRFGNPVVLAGRFPPPKHARYGQPQDEGFRGGGEGPAAAVARQQQCGGQGRGPGWWVELGQVGSGGQTVLEGHFPPPLRAQPGPGQGLSPPAGGEGGGSAAWTGRSAA